MNYHRQNFGIQELFRPPDDSVDVDIVAVHGLDGHAIDTWTSKPDGVCWLNNSDYLPKVLPNARVLAWGYNASTSSWSGKTLSSDRILQHAQTLVSQLEADRELEGATKRPIIFVCHSLGGIVVKRAIVYAQSRSQLVHIHLIYTCTFGILFFGTPHRGMSKPSLARRPMVRINIKDVASLATPIAKSSLVNALNGESETLQNITDQFVPLMANIHIFFFWEQEKTNFLFKRDYIVDVCSAAPIVDNAERSGIAANHQRMCKFQSPRDQGYRTVIAALRRYVREAPGVVQQRCQRATELQREKRMAAAMELLGTQQSLLFNS